MVNEDRARSGGPTARLALGVGALGVVFGDIGTSPIYTVQTIFNPDDPHPVPVTTDNVYGVLSLVFWSVMIIVTLTYVTLVMHADNDGEGGIMARIALVRRMGARSGRTAVVLATVGVFGAALFSGDSMITPAVSVLSAVEGLKVIHPGLQDWVVPITAILIFALFTVQRRGTGVVGSFFGPVMTGWFIAIGACGVNGILDHPQILAALSPVYAGKFMVGDFGTAFFSLTGVVLAVTGAEALYADMGHFGRKAITGAWLLVVLPALVLNYFGQGALVIANKATTSAPFFLLIPGWARLPMVLFATAATVIASQAVIPGAFSLASQAVELGYLPRLRVVHTSASRFGQVYMPWINRLLMAAGPVLGFAFRSSAALAYAYGMAVTGTITITTLLYLYIARKRWRAPMWLILVGGGALLSVDLLFFAANLTKIVHGAWLPLLIAVVVFPIMTSWQIGSTIVTRKRETAEGPLQAFVDQLSRHRGLVRVPGTAVFLKRGGKTAPLALRANVENTHVLHEHVVIVTIETRPIPRVSDSDRIDIEPLGDPHDGIIYVIARFGYMETPDVRHALHLLEATKTEGSISTDDASFFLSKIELTNSREPTMPAWRKNLFIATSRLSTDATEHFRLPPARTLIVGSR